MNIIKRKLHLSIHNRYKSKLRFRMWLSMVLITMAAILCAEFAVQIFLSKYFLDSSLKASALIVTNASSSISGTYDSELRRFVALTSRASLNVFLKRAAADDATHYIQLNNDLQNSLNDFSTLYPTVSAAVLVNNSGTFFYPIGFRLRSDSYNWFCNVRKNNNGKIIFLPMMQSPFRHLGSVIPISVPLYLSKDSSYTLLADKGKVSLYLYILLDASKIEKYLDLYADKDLQGTLYLADDSGRPVSLSDSADNWTIISSANYKKQLANAFTAGKQKILIDNYYFLTAPVKNSNLHVVYFLDRYNLTPQVQSITHFLILIAIIGILIITLLSLQISMYITKPLKLLMNSVEEIKDNTYTGLPFNPSDDEIGELGSSIDSMQQTIRQQMAQLQLDEREKYNAEVRLLAEQINPHFLYNTLENINMEIFSEHPESASAMIRNLGDYLRIGLSYGSDQITLASEISHVQSYVNIMNYRFHHQITMTYHAQDALMQSYIPKSIFQPMVENSIKHAFVNDGGQFFMLPPAIDISVCRTETEVLYTVTDNGSGFDCDALNALLLEQPENGSRHIGLRNIYRRLNIIYGQIAFTFSSIPYFKNSITIHIAGDKISSSPYILDK